MMQAGIVIWDRNDAAQNEAKAVMLKFPNGKHDDHVDSAAYMGIKAEELMPKQRQEKPKTSGWRDKFLIDQQTGSQSAGWMSA